MAGTRRRRGALAALACAAAAITGAGMIVIGAASATAPIAAGSSNPVATAALEPALRPPAPASDEPAPQPPVRSPTVQNPFAATIQASVDAADSRGYRTSVSVADTATGEVLSAGDGGPFAAESVIKALIAARLLLDGVMGEHSELALDMIARSDDTAANTLYHLAGGDALIGWMGERYGIDIGSPPEQAGGWWSGNLVDSSGLARLYLALRNDPAVWPWLSEAMHSAERHGADGDYQFFGLGEATDGSAAIKQGWGNDRDLGVASYNSTGFVTLDPAQPDRYAVAVLTECPIDDWGSRCQSAVTEQAMRLLGK